MEVGRGVGLLLREALRGEDHVAGLRTGRQGEDLLEELLLKGVQRVVDLLGQHQVHYQEEDHEEDCLEVRQLNLGGQMVVDLLVEGLLEHL